MLWMLLSAMAAPTPDAAPRIIAIPERRYLHPTDVALLGDTDGDGTQELVLRSDRADGTVILRVFDVPASGLQTQPRTVFTGPSGFATSIDAQDIDCDGVLDLVTTWSSSSPIGARIDVHRGPLPRGSFQALQGPTPERRWSHSGTNAPLVERFDAVGDLDGDGCRELVLRSVTGGNDRTTHLTFVGTASYPPDGAVLDDTNAFLVHATASGSRAPALVDADGDGDLDLVLARSYGDRLEVVEDIPVGTRGEVSLVRSGAWAIGTCNLPEVAVGDFDGDGDPDLVYSCQRNPVQVLPLPQPVPSTGRINMRPQIEQVDLPSRSSAYSPTLADLDGDGRDDLLVIVYGTQWYLGGLARIPGRQVRGGGVTPLPLVVVDSTTTVAIDGVVVLADVDGDGLVDPFVLGRHLGFDAAYLAGF